MMSLKASALSASAPCSFWRPGSVTSRAIIATATCIAVGNVSFDDWLMLTWSFGWTGFLEPISPPSISMARFEITSLAFMFDWVPDPVCQTTSGKWSSHRPSTTSAAALTIAPPSSGSRRPCSMLVSAAACLIAPSARTMATGCFSHPIGKFMIERWVCAPQ